MNVQIDCTGSTIFRSYLLPETIVSSLLLFRSPRSWRGVDSRVSLGRREGEALRLKAGEELPEEDDEEFRRTFVCEVSIHSNMSSS